nr:hypothetical protein [Armatimonadota bacterium]
MPIFFKTTPGSRGRGRHSHIVYWKEEQTFDEEMGQPVPGGVTSTDKKHYHEVVINPDTGAPDVLAAGVDEHTHDLIEMEEIDTRDAAKEQEKDIVS